MNASKRKKKWRASHGRLDDRTWWQIAGATWELRWFSHMLGCWMPGRMVTEADGRTMVAAFMADGGTGPWALMRPDGTEDCRTADPPAPPLIPSFSDVCTVVPMNGPESYRAKAPPE